jgi:hypothetical protein
MISLMRMAMMGSIQQSWYQRPHKFYLTKCCQFLLHAMFSAHTTGLLENLETGLDKTPLYPKIQSDDVFTYFEWEN